MSQVIEQATSPEIAPLQVPSPRLDSLDLLRGVAILGILLMNIQCMSMPSWAYYNPTDYGLLDGPNYAVWILIHVIADMKFITTFSILFGAGIALQSQRVSSRRMSAAAVHYRRMLVLLVIGLIHAHVFWFGDILVAYASCGMILYPFRRLPSAILIVAGVFMIAVATFNAYAIEENIAEPIPSLRAWSVRLTEETSAPAFEVEAYRGGWLQQMQSRSPLALDNETASFLIWSLWRVGGAVLIGMGLHGLQFFHGSWTRSAYAFMACALIPIGWSMSGLGVLYNHMHQWDWEFLRFPGMQFNYWGSLVACLGYISFGVLIAVHLSETGPSLMKILAVPVRAVGRTAFSNYLLQTLICTTIFYGHGFGRFGHYTRVRLLGLTVVIWVFQLVVSAIWLRLFRQGPMEWLWHRLVYGRRVAR